MSERGVTTITLKQINKEKVYQYIYRTKQTSKLQIVQDLKMGLSTVSQNLNVLEENSDHFLQGHQLYKYQVGLIFVRQLFL